ANLRALADQHQRLGIAQPLRQRIDVLDVIVPDRHVMACQRGEAIERAHRVVIVVEDGDFHEWRMVSGEWRMANSNCCAYHSLFPIRHSRLFTKKNRAITARLSSPAWGRRRHLPEGNSCLHYGCHLGGWGNRIASQRHDYASAL